jgi:hypothetical protein
MQTVGGVCNWSVLIGWMCDAIDTFPVLLLIKLSSHRAKISGARIAVEMIQRNPHIAPINIPMRYAWRYFGFVQAK